MNNYFMIFNSTEIPKGIVDMANYFIFVFHQIKN